MRESVSPARSHFSDMSDGGSSSAALSDVLANSQLGGSSSRGGSSPATSHASRSSSEYNCCAAASSSKQSSKENLKGLHNSTHSIAEDGGEHFTSSDGPGDFATDPVHEEAEEEPRHTEHAHQQDADLVEYDTLQLIHRLATLLQNLTKTNDKLRQSSKPPTSTAEAPSSSPPTSSSSSASANVAPVQDAALSHTPELAQTSLARCTPRPVSPQTAWPEQSSSRNQDYFSMQPHRPKTASSDSARRSSTVHRRFNSDAAEEPPDVPQLTGARIAYKSRNPTICFQARNIPAIGIEQYLFRIQKYCPTTNEVYIALLIYFDRLTCMHASYTQKSAPGFALDSYNVHRLLISGLAVASKFLSDIFYTNSRYAKVGGLPLNEFNQLELQMLMLLDFRLDAPAQYIMKYANALLLSDEQSIVASQPPQKPAAQPMAIPGDESNGSSTSKRPTSRMSLHRASSESGSSTIGGRSDCSSVCSTGTIVHHPGQRSSTCSTVDGDESQHSMEVESHYQEQQPQH